MRMLIKSGYSILFSFGHETECHRYSFVKLARSRAIGTTFASVIDLEHTHALRFSSVEVGSPCGRAILARGEKAS
jgi:hypothetical protein